MTEQQERELTAGLRALAASTSQVRASQQVEDAVFATMNQHVAREHVAREHVSTSHVARRTPRVFLPLAAALILVVGGALWTARTVQPKFVSPTGFVALPEAGVLPQMESATIVRVWLPVAALPGYGIAIVDLKSDSIVAELLVAQDGQPRAIRFVNDSD